MRFSESKITFKYELKDAKDRPNATVTYEIHEASGKTISDLGEDFKNFLSAIGYGFAIGDSFEIVNGEENYKDLPYSSKETLID